MVFLSLPQSTRQWGGIEDSSRGNVRCPITTMDTMAYNGSQVNIAEIGSHGFPRVSCYGYRGDQVGNGRKWSKMGCRGYLVGNGFPHVSRHGHRGDQVGNGRKWPKITKNGLPRLFGRKWISACFTPFPYYQNSTCKDSNFHTYSLLILSFNTRNIYQWIFHILH